MADGGPSNDDIAMRITALREAMGYKDRGGQTGFAKLIEVTQPALNNYESGLRRPDPDVAIRIHAKTGAGMTWLYTGDRVDLAPNLRAIIPDLSRRQQKRA